MGDNFQSSDFWDREFYCDIDGLYDWYSAESWLAEKVLELADSEIRSSLSGPCIAEGANPSSQECGTLSVLDVGCGTSPLLFRLAGQKLFCNLVGVDFSEKAISICQKQLEKRAYKSHGASQFFEEVLDGSLESDDDDGFQFDDLPTELPSFISMQYIKLDACTMSDGLPSQRFDFIIDKGCLDCFISGEGQEKIVRYFDEITKLLKPNGKYVLVPVSGANIPLLISSMVLAADQRTMSLSGTKKSALQAWSRNKKIHQPYCQRLYIQRIIAQDEKHIFVCSLSNRTAVEEIECGVCSKRFPYPEGYPSDCSTCSNKIERFALS